MQTITSYFIMCPINSWDNEEEIKKTYMFKSVSLTPMEAWSRFIGHGHEEHERASLIQRWMGRGYHIQQCEITF